MNDELLIQLVEQNSHLYNKTVKEYKDNKLKENTWVSIAEYLNSTPDAVKKRWENLRDRFVRAYREYTKKLPSGSAALQKKIDFTYFESMMWLAPFIRRKKLSSSAQTAEYYLGEQTASEVVEESEVAEGSQVVNNSQSTYDGHSDGALTPPLVTEASMSQQTGTPELFASPRLPKLKNNMLQESMTQAMNTFNKLCASRMAKQSASESDLNFMKSIVEDMQILPPAKKLKFKKEVLEVLIKYADD